MSRTRALIFGTTLCLAPGALLAQGLDDVRRETFRHRDGNGDRQLTQAEYGGHPGNFAALDANSDGVLSEDEFVFRRGRQAQALPQQEVELRTEESPDVLFNTLDRNRDGYVTANEWSGSKASFQALDTNGDARLTRDEHRGGMQSQSGDWAARFMQRDRNRDGRLSAGEWRSDEGLTFQQVDTNDDRFVTLHEYVYRPAPDDPRTAFDALDRNRDGRLVRGEWRRSYDEFARLDRNNDGYVLWAEYRDPLAADSDEGRFQALDRNNNGVLTRNEYRGQSVPFVRMDRNDDGVISLAEFLNQQPGDEIENAFYAADRDSDGVLSRREWTSDRATFRVADRNRDGFVNLREYRLLPVASNTTPVALDPSRDARFHQLDRNGDGAVTVPEWRGDSASFDILDASGDGRLSRYEYTNTARLEVKFRELDRNDDGRLQVYEWRGDRAYFDTIDTNDDGLISMAEFVL